MKNSLKTLGLSAVLALAVSTTNAQDAATQGVVADTSDTIAGGLQCTDEAGCLIAGIRFGNPFDPSSWWNANEGSKAGSTIAFNFTDPDFWMMFMEPEMRGTLHAAVLNPATYGQFLELETYADMMDPSLIAKWFDLETYDAVLKPQNYAYFMQPGAYSHLIELEHYLQFTELSAYEGLLESALDSLNLFN